MSDPTRWMNDKDAPREIVEMLEAMPAPKPAPPSLHQRLASRFGQTPAAAPGLLGHTFWMKATKISAAVLLGGGAVLAAARGPVAHLAHRRASSAPIPVDGREPSPTPAMAPPSMEAPAPLLADPPAPSLSDPSPPVGDFPGSPASTPAPVRGRAAGNGQGSMRRTETDTLAEEEAILEDARRAIGSAPQRALRLLNLHQRRFPSGELTAERLFLRADAYRRLGRTTDAHREADALVKSFPSSAYARLVADLVDSQAAPKP